MNKEELAKLLAEHLCTDDVNFINQCKENPPQVIEKLQWQPGEGVVSELDDKDKFQLITRYLNNEGIYIKNILHFMLRIEALLTFIAEKFGVDVAKCFKEDAEKKARLVDENIETAKQALKDSVKKN